LYPEATTNDAVGIEFKPNVAENATTSLNTIAPLSKSATIVKSERTKGSAIFALVNFVATVNKRKY